MRNDVETLVIGAGISGLTYAHELTKNNRDVLVVDAGDRAGGSIRTDVVDGFLIERGPNSVRITDELEALIIDLDLASDLVSGDANAPRYLFHRGKLHPAPAGPRAFFKTPILSRKAKLRLFAEPFMRRPREDREWTIREFVSRRLGREINDTIVDAVISGIYAGDTSRLSADAVFPKLVELERQHGGIVRGGIASFRKSDRSKARTPRKRPITVASFESGLAALPAAIAAGLGDRLSLNTAVISVERSENGFVVQTSDSAIATRRLVLATPSHVASTLLRGTSTEAAEALARIEYAPLVSMSVAYREDDVEHPCDGFGFLAPRDASLRVLGAIFASSLFDDRAPEGWASFTCFVGGVTDPAAVALDDAELSVLVATDLEKAIGARGTPRVLGIARWEKAIPQYTLGHLGRIEAAENACGELGIKLLGNYLRGVSVGDCVELAKRAAGSGE